MTGTKIGERETRAGCKVVVIRHGAETVEVVVTQKDGKSHTFACRRDDATAIGSIFGEAGR